MVVESLAPLITPCSTSPKSLKTDMMMKSKMMFVMAKWHKHCQRHNRPAGHLVQQKTSYSKEHHPRIRKKNKDQNEGLWEESVACSFSCSGWTSAQALLSASGTNPVWDNVRSKKNTKNKNTTRNGSCTALYTACTVHNIIILFTLLTPGYQKLREGAKGLRRKV